ncbi:MAG: SocA family protein [Magnetococcales bacterium]|nr:SocA family protein [Magnetococcales bacterium]
MSTPTRKITSSDVANYFLSMVDDDAGDLVSNLKLQKLVYYAQGFHLAMFGRPLFEEAIEAWTHGPVVPSLYHGFKQYGPGPIPRPEEMDFGLFPEELRRFLDEVYNVYGQYDAWKLRNMTHEEPPWRETYDRGVGGVISTSAMADYFKTQLQ